MGKFFPFSFHIWSAIPDFSISPCTTAFRCSSLTFSGWPVSPLYILPQQFLIMLNSVGGLSWGRYLRRQSSGGCRFNPNCRRVTIQEYLTLVPGYALRNQNRRPCKFNKGYSSKFRVGSRFRQTPEEVREDISAKTLRKITIKMKTIVWKHLMIKIIKLRLRNSDK